MPGPRACEVAVTHSSSHDRSLSLLGTLGENGVVILILQYESTSDTDIVLGPSSQRIEEHFCSKESEKRKCSLIVGAMGVVEYTP